MTPTSRREFLRLGAAATGALALKQPIAAAAPPRKPNLVLIFSDQQHWQAFGLMDPSFKTPAIDAIAKDAAVFEQAFCTSPQCTPSRASLLTGLYPHKTGVIGNLGLAGFGEIAELGLRTVAVRLKGAGYRTAYFGKWHLGDVPAALEGWDEMWTTDGGDIDGEVTRRACEFLSSAADDARPFVLVLSYVNPHHIYGFSAEQTAGQGVPVPRSWARETFRGKPPVQKQYMTEDQGAFIWSAPEKTWELYRGLYREKVREYDAEVGAAAAKLKEHGLWDSTVLILTSDHGDMDGNHRLIFKGPFMYEHMVRVPLIVRVPRSFGGTGARRIRESAVLTDIVPTLLDFAKAPTIPCDGYSLKPALTGTGSWRAREFVISEYYGKQRWTNPIRMIRTQRYKYNLYLRQGEELYDLNDDPDELTNLASDPRHKSVRDELSGRLDRWIAANADPFYSYGTTTRGGKAVP